MFMGKLGKTKVLRYRRGRAPEWADNVEEDSVVDALGMITRNPTTHEVDLYMVNMCEDPRLCRLNLKECRTDKREKVIADHILFRQVEGVKEEENIKELDPEEENDYDIEMNRIKTRKKLLSRMQQEDLSFVSEGEEDEEESEYEEDPDDEPGDSLMERLVFVAKEERLTTAIKERQDAMKLSLVETKEKRRAEMKTETKKIVVEDIKKGENIQKSLDLGGDNIADVDTDDEVDAADEYKAWVKREVSRIRRDSREIREVKNGSEEKILEWEREHPRPAKRKLRRMQVYYHKGVFFQSDADDPTGTVGADYIYRRDFSEPTGEDKMNKTILPKVMQVKRFGRSGRTKWTHLVNEDTTDWSSPWAYNDSLGAKYVNKMAGMKPIAKRRRKLDS